MRPENRSVIENSVEPSAFGVSVKVRTPLNIGAMPSLHTIERPASTRDTFGLKTRSGDAGTFSFSVSPSAMRPSMLVTVEFHVGNFVASVRSVQILSGVAWMVARIAHSIWNVPNVFVALAFFMSDDPRTSLRQTARSRRGARRSDPRSLFGTP